jgi:hypothetical protein
MKGHKEYFERPVNSGNLWYRNGKPAGRVELKEEIGSGKLRQEIIEGAAHKEWIAPMTKDQKLSQDLAQKDNEIAYLKQQVAENEKAQQVAEAKTESAKISVGDLHIDKAKLKKMAEDEVVKQPSRSASAKKAVEEAIVDVTKAPTVEKAF